jgi:mono/diheme cytochrome c family protein
VPRSFTVVLLVTVVACGGNDDRPVRDWTPDDHGRPDPGTIDRSRVPQGEEPEEPEGDPAVRAAAALYRVSCASCHGPTGRGDGPARPPGAQMPDFASAEWQAGVTDERMAESIRLGQGLMPPFGDRIRPQGIEALVVHIRGLGGARPAPPGPEPPPQEQPPPPDGQPPELPPGHP